MDAPLIVLAIFIIHFTSPLLAKVITKKTVSGKTQIYTERFILLAVVITIICSAGLVGDIFIEGESTSIETAIIHLSLLAISFIFPLGTAALESALEGSTYLFSMLPICLMLGMGATTMVYSHARKAIKLSDTEAPRLARDIMIRIIVNSPLAGIFLLLLGYAISLLFGYTFSLYFYCLFFVLGLLYGILLGVRHDPLEKVSGERLFWPRPYSDIWLREYYKNHSALIICFGSALFLSRNVYHSYIAFGLALIGFYLALCVKALSQYSLYEKRNNVRLTIVYTDSDPPPVPSAV